VVHSPLPVLTFSPMRSDAQQEPEDAKHKENGSKNERTDTNDLRLWLHLAARQQGTESEEEQQP
jgi:hypothetical protein